MIKQIRTYDDLLEEQARLKMLFSAQRELVRQDINEIKLELMPVRKAISVIGKFATRDNRAQLITSFADTMIDIGLRKLIFSKAGFLTKLVLPFIIKNFSSHVIADNKDKIISKLSSLFGKKHENGKAPVSPEDKKPLAEEQED